MFVNERICTHTQLTIALNIWCTWKREELIVLIGGIGKALEWRANPPYEFSLCTPVPVDEPTRLKTGKAKEWLPKVGDRKSIICRDLINFILRVNMISWSWSRVLILFSSGKGPNLFCCCLTLLFFFSKIHGL